MKDLILSLLMIAMLFVMLIGLYQQRQVTIQLTEAVNQHRQTNIDACQWVVNQGMEAPEHCFIYLTK